MFSEGEEVLKKRVFSVESRAMVPKRDNELFKGKEFEMM